MRVTFRSLTTPRLREQIPPDMQKRVAVFTREWAETVKKTMQTYPPPRRSIHYPYGYPRTGHLRTGWRVTQSMTRGGLRTSIYNLVRYAKYVHGPNQVWYHAETGWPVLERALRRVELHKVLRKFYRQNIRGA